MRRASWRRRVLVPLLVLVVAGALWWREESRRATGINEVRQAVLSWCEELPQPLPVVDPTLGDGFRSAMARISNLDRTLDVRVKEIDHSLATHEAVVQIASQGPVGESGEVVLLLRRDAAGVTVTGYR